jgi:transcriptional regulator with XRE-family HTH domain
VKPEQRPRIQADRTQGKRGRKPARQSRATEIRTKLLAWKHTPEPQRISLRALAAKLGTSHQLLSVYLRGLDNWQKKDYQRSAATIRSLAKAENRHMTPWEQSQVATLERAAFQYLITSALTSALKRYEEELGKKAGGLTRTEHKLVKMLAQRGLPFAQKLLQKHQINLPPKPIRAS